MKNVKHSLWLLALCAIAFTACDREEDNPIIPDFNESELIVKDRTDNGNVETVFNELAAAVDAKGLMTVAKIDHAANAASVDLNLRPTKTIIFGNPAAGTQLMQSDQRIGLDLPLKFVVWEDDDGDTKVGYYNASTLTQRYSISDKSEVVDMVNTALEDLTGGEAADEPDAVDDISNKMITKKSSMNVADTYAKLVEAIESKEPLNIMAQVEHDVAAEGVDMELRPTKLVVFGNPAIGTKFMETDQRIGIDLPMKILVWEDAAGETWVGYYNATTLTDRYDITNRDEEVDMVNEVLNSLSEAAITP